MFNGKQMPLLLDIVIGLASKRTRQYAIQVTLTEIPTWARRGPYRWIARRMMVRWHKADCWQMAQTGHCDHYGKDTK